MLIGVLVVVAAALLVGAFLTGSTALAVVALVVSVGTAVLYVLLLRRDPATAGSPAEGSAEAETPKAEASKPESVEASTPKHEPTGAVATAEPKTAEPAKTPSAKAEPAEPQKPKSEPAEPPAATAEPLAKSELAGPAEPARALTLDGATVVHVVPGRMRYHVDGCGVLDGQEVEDLTVDDARDEGFTACSRCAARRRSPATA